MARRKQPAIPDALLDQLLDGADPRTPFNPDGVIDALKKTLAERMLNAEMDQHLGTESADGRANTRNGYGPKTVLTDTGWLALDIPRDQQGTFDPQLIAKYQRRCSTPNGENPMRHYACAIFIDSGRLLLGKRAPHRKAYANKWDVIGDLVEDGESLEGALVRELSEKVGVRPTRWESLCSVVDDSPEARGVATYHMFTVRAWSGDQPTMVNDEHTALTWSTVEKACALDDLALEDYRNVFRKISF